MKFGVLFTSCFNRKQLSRRAWILLCLCLLGIWGCPGKTTTPTTPETETPTPTPAPSGTETPEVEDTPTPQTGSCDNYGDRPDDALRALEPDGDPYNIIMECTGDIDWYKLELSSLPVDLEIVLNDIPDKRDFDIVVYDSSLRELEDGRSAQSGNTEERLTLTVEHETLLYLKIYSYSGQGVATLTVTGTEPDENGADPEPDFEQVSYEEVLSEEFPFYPRGSSTGLLEQSVETLVVEPVTCQIDGTELTGELSIGNYAHVERELLESADYIDGWAIVVFNGSQDVLNQLTLTIQVTIFDPGIDLDVSVPSEMEIRGSDYLISKSGDNVYFTSQSYGDFLGNSQNDIRISSGVVGDLGDLFSQDIFTQQVDVEWKFEDDEGNACSGRARGDTIVDFQITNSFQWLSGIGRNR